MVNLGQSSLTAFGFKKARTETEATENTDEPAEIKHDDSDIDYIGTTSESAMVSVSHSVSLYSLILPALLQV